MKALLGGKGANLAEMSNLGLPVPPGFTISTEVCTWFYANDQQLSRRPDAAGRRGAGRGRAASSACASATPERPLLVSVRSGAPVSMPGMMDTVLNLGLNDRTVEGLAAASGDRALRLRQLSPLHPDVRRRRAGGGPLPVRGGARGRKQARGCRFDTDLDAAALAELVESYKAIVAEGHRQAVPAGSQGAALGRHRRRVRLLGDAARGDLPAAAQHLRATWAPPSPSRPWCSATWATTAPPASPSPATPRPASAPTTASS